MLKSKELLENHRIATECLSYCDILELLNNITKIEYLEHIQEITERQLEREKKRYKK
jgi:hypothetical protein